MERIPITNCAWAVPIQKKKKRGMLNLQLMILVAGVITITNAGPALAQTPRLSGVYKISQVTGNHLEENGFNQLDNESENIDSLVWGTDLGSAFIGGGGTVRLFFGDTVAGDGFGGVRLNGRNNILATTTDKKLSDGLRLNYEKDNYGVAREIIPHGGVWWPFYSIGRYPTTGWSYAGVEYAAVTDINQYNWSSTANTVWFTTDEWNTVQQSFFNFMALPGGENFQMVYTMPYEEFFYFYGAKLARTAYEPYTSGIQIMRIKKEDVYTMIHNASAAPPEIYTVCNTWKSVWETGSCAPKNIIDAPAGEGSVIYHPGYDKFISVYFNPAYGNNKGNIRLSLAADPQGPWTEPSTIITCDNCGQYDNCYAPLLLPTDLSGQNSNEVYFLFSRMVGFGAGNECGASYFCDPYTGACPTNCHEVYNTFLMEIDFYPSP